ncbi:alpha/beta fold hydrolase [Paenibacillus harenae]|uniref:alpha/beta fold hydrolase n=1 Tax=Paenibacillus harenae TaxID=306543 RepID=UPI0004098FA2|nr:alpha/beta hydrolase [Paenibacillus harenae]
MKNIKKWMKISAAVCIVLTAVCFIRPTWTPAIEGSNTISVLKKMEVNDTSLEVMIRGTDRSNPVLLFVHGGPGYSEIPYARKYEQLLEQHFTVVHYDQRGSGKSHQLLKDYSQQTVDQHVDDLLRLTESVSLLLGQEKILLAGHSFGTHIGMQAAAAAPDKFHAYIGIGQVSDSIQSELDGLEYTLMQAVLAGNKRDITKLESLRDEISDGERLTPRNLVAKYGGSSRLIHFNREYWTGLLTSPEYNWLDAVRFLRGVLSGQDILISDRKKKPLINRLEIPCYFVMGKYDYMTSADAAKVYFDSLEAPVKEYVLFDRSAHFPHYEEQELFAEWLLKMWEELILAKQ